MWVKTRLHMFEHLRYSLAGQATRLSLERPGFESWWRDLLGYMQQVARRRFALRSLRADLSVSSVSLADVVLPPHKNARAQGNPLGHFRGIESTHRISHIYQQQNVKHTSALK